LFHLPTFSSAENWRKQSQRDALTRAFDHRKMKVVCGRTSGRQFPKSSSAAGNHLRNIAGTFVDLQELRHLADYDNGRKWSRTEVLEDIELVRLAFESWEAIKADAVVDEFLLQLLIQR